MLVRLANQFESAILIGRGGEMVDCKSILSLLTLGAAMGTELSLSAEGDDAEGAIDAIDQFFQRGFDEASSDEVDSGPAVVDPVQGSDPTSSA